MADTILVVAEQRRRATESGSLETLTGAQAIAKETGWAVEAAVVGAGVGDCRRAGQSQRRQGVRRRVRPCWSPTLRTDLWRHSSSFIEQKQPKLVLMPHTYQVRDFAPKLATASIGPLISDAIGYKYEGGKLLFTRQMFQGKFAADVSFAGDRAVLRDVSDQAHSAATRLRWVAAPAPVETVTLRLPTA